MIAAPDSRSRQGGLGEGQPDGKSPAQGAGSCSAARAAAAMAPGKALMTQIAAPPSRQSAGRETVPPVSSTRGGGSAPRDGAAQARTRQVTRTKRRMGHATPRGGGGQSLTRIVDPADLLFERSRREEIHRIRPSGTARLSCPGAGPSGRLRRPGDGGPASLPLRAISRGEQTAGREFPAIRRDRIAAVRDRLRAAAPSRGDACAILPFRRS